MASISKEQLSQKTDPNMTVTTSEKTWSSSSLVMLFVSSWIEITGSSWFSVGGVVCWLLVFRVRSAAGGCDRMEETTLLDLLGRAW